MLIEKILTYDYSKIADWMIKTGVVLLAAAKIATPAPSARDLSTTLPAF